MLSGDMGADNAQAGSLALPAQDKAFGQNNISADQVVHWDRDTPGERPSEEDVLSTTAWL